MPWSSRLHTFFHPRRRTLSTTPLSPPHCTLNLHDPLKQSHATPPLVHLPPNHEHLLLSLLLKHQSKPNPSAQIHCQLISTALHRDHMSLAGMMLWNTLLRHYSYSPQPFDAIHLYKQMLDLCTPLLPADTFTFSFLLKTCSNLANPIMGIQFHALVVKKGFEFHVYVHTALVDMYVTGGVLVDARRAFDEMPAKNSVAWNAMITGLARWGEVGVARLLFEQMPDRDVISWTVMIDAYTRARRPTEALELFLGMLEEGAKPSEITILAIVPAISNLGDLDMAGCIHAYCRTNGLDSTDVRVENSIIDMYAKCGSIENSLKVFEEMMSHRRNLVSWTSIISAFAMHGMAKEAVKLYEEMENENFKPNQVTFLSVLNACSHGGLVEAGMRFFSSMVYRHGIEPEIKHYGCVIDMLGRAGRLREAEKMITEMPVKVNVVVWRTLLGCCSKHEDLEMGERVMRRILGLERGYSGDYVVLSNMLTLAGRFGDAERVRRLMDESNVLKVPGFSLLGRKE